MSEYGRGADAAVLAHIDDAWEALKKAADASKNSDNPRVKSLITSMCWDAQDMVALISDELFMIEDTDG